MCGPPNALVAVILIIACLAGMALYIYILWRWIKRIKAELRMVRDGGWSNVNFLFWFVTILFFGGNIFSALMAVLGIEP